MTGRVRIGLVSAWASRLGGGVFEAVVAHCAMLTEQGFDPVVIALDDAHSAEDRGRFAGIAEVVTCRVVGPRAIGFAPSMVGALRAARLDLVHLHGIWTYPSRAASRWARLTARPYVISPHGMLDPWIISRGTAKKALARIGYERRSWRRASLFHALTGQEAHDIAAVTGCGNAIVTIPNAVRDTATAFVPRSARRACRDGPYVLYLGRIHPKKNIDGLIAGWKLAAAVLQPLGATLIIAGWGDTEHVATIERAVAEATAFGVTFAGPVFGPDKADLIENARFLALPSYSEGLPMVVLEAWAAGTPALISQHCNVPEGLAGGAAIDTGTVPATIADALRTGFALTDAAWQAMAQAARTLVEQRFSPDRIATQWHATYRDLLAAETVGLRGSQAARTSR